MATLPPATSKEPPAEGAPTCIICQAPGTWKSPTGHWACEDCKRMVNLTRMSPEELAAAAIPERWGTLSELLDRNLDPIRWTVEGMIPEGLTVLAGKPKLGKSWLALILALAVATGKDFLGYPTVLGECLYIALEDSERRMQERAIYLGAKQMGPGLERFHYRTSWASLDRGGLDHLELWMLEYPDTKLVVVDTFGKLRGDLPGRDKYAEEYKLVGGLQTFAQKHGIALVLIHHLRKMGADDWLEQLSGSQAISGSADTILGLYRERGQMDATLRTVSRDVEELELALLFNGGRWAYMGPAEEYRLTEERRLILEAIKDLGGEGKVSDIAGIVGQNSGVTSKLLRKMATESVVKATKYGYYSMGEVGELSTNAPPTSPTSTTSPNLQLGTSHLTEGDDPPSFDDLDFDPADLDWQEEE